MVRVLGPRCGSAPPAAPPALMAVVEGVRDSGPRPGSPGGTPSLGMGLSAAAAAAESAGSGPATNARRKSAAT